MRTETLAGRSPYRALSATVLAAATLALTACGGAEVAAPPQDPSAGASTQAGAAEAARIGAAGSGCELPVTFGLAESWQAEAVAPMAPDDPLAELARRGPLTMVCEIDAKPAGNIGFLRVWTGDGGQARASLEAFLGTEAREPAYTELRIGDRPAVEVTYQTKSALDDGMKPERAFAVQTARGIVAVSLDSADSEEHTEMLPAYELAKRTLTVTR
ncbi:lipoprotein [Micromonospora cathayae]|uniref:Lipoprotein n=1 Tax=Micromonospora cathayae TaxID=3028804 RepID=A0ABY7ZQS7_9ACTN|nr:lipoprotein [Micromonospora sp. HUAS 3]WDZ84858.1 lipoprotein [Micromonospora sp. HUAS 3]